MLRRLDVGGAFLTTLPEEMGLLVNLNYLEMRKNQLTVASFPKSFAQLKSLQRILMR